MHISPLVFSVAALVAAAPAWAQDGLQRCRAMPNDAARLACYDTLADASRAPLAAAKPSRAADADKPSAPGASAAPASAPAGNAAFGLTERRSAEAVDSVESSVASNFSGWEPNSRIKLANGQVWQVVDGSSASLSEGARKVRVKRGFLSAFFLEIEGLNTSPRVRRVE
jgi:hypothetical protein